MRVPALLTLPALVLGLAVGPLSTSASADQTAELSGSFQLMSFDFTSARPTGGVTQFTMTSTTAIYGDLVGETYNELTCVGDDTWFTCRGDSVFEGTFDGEEATSTSQVVFRCSYVTGDCAGRNSIRSGTGALAGNRGWTKFEQDAVTGAGTYTSHIVFV